MAVYLMRAPILSGFGEYKYTSLTTEEARKILGVGKFISGIRYQWDADLLRDIIGIYIPINRGGIKMEVGDTAVVFEFPPAMNEGDALAKDAKTPMCVGLLTRTS